MTSAVKTVFSGYNEPEAAAAHSSATDFFSSEPVKKAISHRNNCVTRALTISNNGPLHVIIPPEADYFIDPASFRINAEIRVKKQGAGGAFVELVEADEKIVAPINVFSKCLFRQIDIFIQSKKNSRTVTDAYGIKAYLETVCSYGRDAEEGHLCISYSYRDDPGKADDIEHNNGFKERAKFISYSKKVIISEPMHTELSTLKKLVPSGVDIQFQLHMADVNTILQYSGCKYEMQYEDFFLSYDRVALEPKLLYSIESKLSKMQPTIFPVTRGVIYNKQIPQGESNALWSILYQGILPETVTICMLSSSALNGAHKENYFNFQHFGLKSISLKKNYIPIPAIPIETNYDENEVTRLMRHFYDNMGIETSNAQCVLTYEDFCKGSTIIPFDLTANRRALYHNHEKNSGTIDVDIKFSRGLAKGITVLALCTFTDTFYVTGPINNRQVYFTKRSKLIQYE